MTRQVTDLLLLYQSINFPTPPLLATRLLSFFNLFFFPLIHGIHHKSSTPLRTLTILLTINRLFFHSLSSTKFISPFLSLPFSGSQIYCLSLQYHHRFLSSSLKICRYHSKMPISTPSIYIQSFSLSQAQPILRKKTLLQKSVLTISRIEKKNKIFTAKKAPLQIYFKLSAIFAKSV